MSLAVAAYVLAVAVFIPVSGWFADRYGARRVFVAGAGAVHPGLGALRPGAEFRHAGGDAGAAGAGRRDDDAGRPPDPAAQLSPLRTDDGDDLYDLARDHGAGARPAAGRGAHHLSVLALDLLRQSAVRRSSGIAAGAALRREYAASHDPGRFDCRRLSDGGLRAGPAAIRHGECQPAGHSAFRHCGRLCRRGGAAAGLSAFMPAASPRPAVDLDLFRRRSFRVGTLGGRAVPHRHERCAVPVAADAAGGLRAFAHRLRLDHLHRLRRRDCSSAPCWRRCCGATAFALVLVASAVAGSIALAGFRADARPPRRIGSFSSGYSSSASPAPASS